MSDTDTDAISMALATTLPLAAEEGGEAIPNAFDPAKRYEVTFAKVVEISPFRYTPRDGAIIMKGGALARILAEKGSDVFRSAIER